MVLEWAIMKFDCFALFRPITFKMNEKQPQQDTKIKCDEKMYIKYAVAGWSPVALKTLLLPSNDMHFKTLLIIALVSDIQFVVF